MSSGLQPNQITCCLGQVVGSECASAGFLPGSTACRNLPQVKQACSIALRDLVSRQADADGFYPGLTVQDNVAPSLVTIQSSRRECKALCDRDIQCTAVDVFPITSGKDSGKFQCQKHIVSNPNLVAPPNPLPGISAAISGGLSSRCETICSINPTAENPTPQWCQDVSLAACAGNIKHPFCQRFCALKGVNCDREIKQYCDNLGIEKAKDDEFCGCFLPTPFYENYYADLKKKASFSTSLTTENRICTFPRCASSILKPYAAKQGQEVCPDVFQCIIVPTVNNNGTISGDINIKDNVTCNQSVKKNTDGGGGDGGGKPPPDRPKKLRTGAILGIVLGVITVLGIILGLIFASSKKKKVVVALPPVTTVVSRTAAPVIAATTAPVVSGYDRWGVGRRRF